MAIAVCENLVDDQGQELLVHGSAQFPVACYADDLAREPVPWHWHNEWECAVVAQGRAEVAVGTEHFTAEAGEGYFIHAGVLHSMCAAGDGACRLQAVVFHPSLVGGSPGSVFDRQYVQPLLARGSPPCVRLRRGEAWQAAALDEIAAAWHSCARETAGYELAVRAALSRLAFQLTLRGPAAPPPTARSLRETARMKAMLRYIEQNLDAPLDTAAIAASAAVSESECLRCFRRTIGLPPVQYVRQLRIRRAAALLRETDLSVSEIGARCGFPDASYFAKTFRALTGRSPGAYRRSDEPPVAAEG